jgi:hypothetical protein
MHSFFAVTRWAAKIRKLILGNVGVKKGESHNELKDMQFGKAPPGIEVKIYWQRAN